MDHVVRLMEQFGLVAVFLNVLLDEGGLPLPASPLLAVAGALAARGEFSIASIIAAAVAGSFVADNAWYWLGRRHGRGVLGLLCKLSLSPDACVRQTETLFARPILLAAILLTATLYAGATFVTPRRPEVLLHRPP